MYMEKTERTMTHRLSRTTNQFMCPKCHGSYFGSTFDSKDNSVNGYACHDQYDRGCRESGPYAKMFVTIKRVIIEGELIDDEDKWSDEG